MTEMCSNLPLFLMCKAFRSETTTYYVFFTTLFLKPFWINGKNIGYATDIQSAMFVCHICNQLYSYMELYQK